jgi:hypothetical protein
MHVSVPAGSIWKYNTVAYQTACHCTLAAAAGSSAQGLTREWVLGPIGCSAASERRPRVFKDTDPPNNDDSTMMPHSVGFFSSPRDKHHTIRPPAAPTTDSLILAGLTLLWANTVERVDLDISAHCAEQTRKTFGGCCVRYPLRLPRGG